MKPTIAAIILTKNEETMIANCLETLRWCDEVWVVDQGSSDATVGLAEKYGAKVLREQLLSFAQRRNAVLSQITTDWIMYIDADERITPSLSKEILVHIETTQANALTFARQNTMYGTLMQHGGWSEKVTRVFRRSTFQGWQGDIHESPVFSGDNVFMHTPLIHLTHRNTVDGLQKTIAWTPIEAQLLAQSPIKKVTLWTLLRKGTMEFVRRAIFKRGYQDGEAGLIEAVVQGINRILVYIQVWELQQHPSLPEKYEQIELQIANEWKKNK